ncbi:MAG TPA: O-antigen ligase family protein [Actinoplanes sp.]|nr:O-antigen ligase family protein [Actinoplanes sp.]
MTERAERHGAHNSQVFMTCLLFLVALAGRFSVPIGGDAGGQALELRTIACSTLAVVTFFWRFRLDRAVRRSRWPSGMVVVMMLIGYQMVSALWAPMGARTGESVGNLVALATLVVCGVVIARPDPDRMARILLWCAMLAAVLYALEAFWAGPGLQGRYSAFGGGPNVFVRVQCVGVISAISLATMLRRYSILLIVPLLLVAAVLSGSRGGLVSLIGTAVAFAVLLRRRLGVGKIVGVAASGASACAVIWHFMEADLYEAVAHRYSIDAVLAGNYSSRPRLAADAMSIFSEAPVVGAGLDSFYPTVGYAIGIDHAHNYLASLAADGGLIGVSLLLLAVVRLWRDGRPWSRRPIEIYGCFLAAVYLGMASLFSGDYYDTRFIWIFAAVLTVASDSRLTGRPPERSLVALETQLPHRWCDVPGAGRR